MIRDGPRIAVVGAGPSGFFSADALLRSGRNICVDMFERLPFPFGLLRYGVAPDHQKIKKAAIVFEATMRLPGYRLFANVGIGTDIPLGHLRANYDAVLLAYGASQGNCLGIPGEGLSGSLSATEFVGWYNGHPDCAALSIDLSHAAAVVIGHGNVALDVCRILGSHTERLAGTDITDYALETLRSSRVRTVYLVGRRGPEEASFTTAELRELAGGIEGCRLVADPEDLPSAERMNSLPDATRRNLEIMRSAAAIEPGYAGKRIVFRFARSVSSIHGSSHVDGVDLTVNDLVGQPGQRIAVPTPVRERLRCGLVVRSAGYRAMPLDGCPFDVKRGIVPSVAGRVIANMAGDVEPALYVVGWLKRGATGVIGTNRADASETSAAILADLNGKKCERDDPVDRLIPSRHPIITSDGWSRIDMEERRQGAAAGRIRQKLPLENAIAIGSQPRQ